MTLELYYNTELGAVIDRNKDTSCRAICVAIRVFHIALYRNKLFAGFPQALEIRENLENHQKKVPCMEKSLNIEKIP